MVEWTPVAILPNLSAKETVDGDVVALTSRRDPRIRSFCAANPAFLQFVSRFTDAFRISVDPVILVVRDDVRQRLSKGHALRSFRDLVAMCVVPYARSLGLVYRTGHRIVYSNSFWLYPWMLAADGRWLVAQTPAISALHEVDKFHGQPSPELPRLPLNDVDVQLLAALLPRWKRHYLGKTRKWQDRALFRSLNMAMQAAQLPGGIDTTVYDLGRTAALWVSAFEILAHPRLGKSGLDSVYPLLERVTYLDRKVRGRRYAAYSPGKKPRPRRPLSCWLYGKLYRARCDFLHGNPLGAHPLHPDGLTVNLDWLAASLYRLALTGFLGLSIDGLRIRSSTTNAMVKYMEVRRLFYDYQGVVERALLRALK